MCLTLCHDGDPVFGVVHDSHLRRTCWAVRGEGAFGGADRLWLMDPGSPHLLTASWIQGYDVGPNDEMAGGIRLALQSRFKRVLQMWAPSIDWSVLVRGKVAAVIAYGEESEDLLCGVVLCREAGGVVVDLDGHEPSRPFSNGLIAGSSAATEACFRAWARSAEHAVVQGPRAHVEAVGLTAPRVKAWRGGFSAGRLGVATEPHARNRPLA